MFWGGVARSSGVLVLWRRRSGGLCQGEERRDAQFAPDQSQSALCTGHPPNFGDRCEGLGGRGLRLAGIVNELLIYGRHLAGPFLVALDLLGTFVFALSGAAARVKIKLDLFGLLVLAFAAGEASGVIRGLRFCPGSACASSVWGFFWVSLPTWVVKVF